MLYPPIFTEQEDFVRLRYCGNHHDPRDPDYERYVRCGCMGEESPQEAIKRDRVWIQSMLIGEPGASDTFSVERMKEMGLVGLYRTEIDEHALMTEPQLIVNYSQKTLLRWNDAVLAWLPYHPKIKPCDHGFVVRDIKSGQRFLCRECDQRFPSHPHNMVDQWQTNLQIASV